MRRIAAGENGGRKAHSAHPRKSGGPSSCDPGSSLTRGRAERDAIEPSMKISDKSAAGCEALRLRRMLPLIVIAVIAVAIVAMGWHRQLSFETLARHHAALRHFIAALGVIPATFAFAFVGAGLASVLTAQETAYHACLAAGRSDCRLAFQMKAALTPELFAALVALGVLALIPSLVRRLRARSRRNVTG